ncbi:MULTISPECIES: subclass B3 metallo-beta-lactamase [unclassified Sphingomonas]|nr:subclass B3 metallo-beta-lactamase [Sphingomonas sp. FARSPH]
MKAVMAIGLALVSGVATGAGPAAMRGPTLRPAPIAEHRATCAGKDGWSDAAPPVRIFANVYDIGTCGITVLLVAGDRGAIVIDAATAEAAPGILANIRRLGLAPRDVRLLLSSHEHVDHAGGFAALARATGATIVATAAEKPGLERGRPIAGDPQAGGSLPPFAPVRVGRVIRDGETIVLGSLRLTAHATPGHAPGSTSWTWRSCAGVTCRRVAYADSVSAVSADGYRFVDHPAYVRRFRAALDRVAALPCDLIVTPHPGASELYERLDGKAPLAAPNACRDYAAAGQKALDARLARERGGGRAGS